MGTAYGAAQGILILLKRRKCDEFKLILAHFGHLLQKEELCSSGDWCWVILQTVTVRPVPWVSQEPGPFGPARQKRKELEKPKLSRAGLARHPGTGRWRPASLGCLLVRLAHE